MVHLRMLGPHANFMESVSDILVKIMHTGDLLEVITVALAVQCSVTPPSSRPKGQTEVLLLG